MDIRKLQRAIVDGLEDVKAQNIRVFNTEHLSPLFERVIVASGTSSRQTKALASSVRESVKSRGLQVLRTEGEANGEWIIVDCGAAVVHIMQPTMRDYYRLEEIWGDKAVRMKMGAPAAKAAARPAKAQAAEADEPRPHQPQARRAAPPVPARRAASASPAVGKAASRKSPAGKPAGRPARGKAAPLPPKAAARKAAPGKRAASAKGPAGAKHPAAAKRRG
jgi:ribosome-associated protein